MTLDEPTRTFLERATATPPLPPGSLPLQEFRAAVESLRPSTFDRIELAEVRDLTCPGPDGTTVSARFYRPETGASAPLVIWAHGGQWVRTTVDLLDTFFRYAAHRSGCAVLAIDYEHAPESRFPAQIEQIYAAALWAQEQSGQLDCDTGRLAIAGDSSGGNLAAAVALLARDRGQVRFQHQLLLVPLLDTLFDSASWRELGQDYLLSVEQLTWALSKYAPGVDRRHPLLSPLHAEDLSALPPTTIVVGEFDPLRDDGLAYARRLEADGVPVKTIDVESLLHHAMVIPKALPRGRVAVEAAADALATCW
ncbi:alpha/beta hydrolase [Mycobacterium sp. 21AC1]|uniref:alpha/beta hydrolase n=1 Tax=[Mycobacterium] appelbergii TaxID=2939269 RepID=UPI002938EAE3|nr:alpha/beta hydrolase [Mycobacterium sp. 21AC1]MDV3123558.1 alpha/beta hydrolase [Mycobacterium sp. 21AC1]